MYPLGSCGIIGLVSAFHSSPTTAERLPTAPLAAAGLIGGFGVAVATGSRPAGGVVLAGFGLACIWIWLRRDGRRTAVLLTVAGLVAFALSHLLGLVIGAWPSVFLVAAGTAALSCQVSRAELNCGV